MFLSCDKWNKEATNKSVQSILGKYIQFQNSGNLNDEKNQSNKLVSSNSKADEEAYCKFLPCTYVVTPEVIKIFDKTTVQVMIYISTREHLKERQRRNYLQDT